MSDFSLDANRPDLTLGIIGAGLMGRGIAQIAAQAKINVLLQDNRPGACQEAIISINQVLGKLAEKGKLSSDDVAAAMARIQIAEKFEMLSSCNIVVEAIVENLDIKRDLFQQLEAVVSNDCLLATNTSSLSVTAIAAACKNPARVGGFHFFSPVPLMKIVEVIAGVMTAPWVNQTLTQLAKRIGHTPVSAKDTPGFIVNHAGRGYGTEALRIMDEGITTYPEIDLILKEAAGFRMGPFELLDLTGLDVSHPVMESIYNQYYQEPRFRPSSITRQRLAAGLLGRKTNQGFYAYADGKIQPVPPAPQVPKVDSSTTVWVSHRNPHHHNDVCSLLAAVGVNLDCGLTPQSESLCVVLPIGNDATDCALAENLDATRVVAVDPLFLGKRRTIMTTPITTTAMRDIAWGLFAADGTSVSIIRDSAGFVAQRVVATIVNIGCDIAQQRIASPMDIDRAVNLGLGYPYGPLAMGDKLGAATILEILANMYRIYGDPRYRPSPWLTRRARLGISLLTDEY